MFVHSFPFDPTYGYDDERLRRVKPAPEPPDFAPFWRETFRCAAAVRRNLAVTASDAKVEGFEVFEVAYTSLENIRIRAWFCLPRDRPAVRGLVISHGYGGRERPDEYPLLADAAMIFPCARGLSLSAQEGIPNYSDAHVLHGITARETYVHRGCAADIWLAASTLLQLAPAAKQRLDYVGESFGGGIGALALPWDERFNSAFLGVPSFGQHPLRLQLPCLGSGESVRKYVARFPEARQVLGYYDASVAARYLRIPTLVAAARFDPFVPPPGQFAIYNAVAGPKRLITRQAAHFEYADAAAEEQSLRAAIIHFLTRPFHDDVEKAGAITD
jgi:cephalosporin-C deacetylase